MVKAQIAGTFRLVTPPSSVKGHIRLVTFRITVEIADPRSQRFEAVEMLVDAGATFTKSPRELMERLGVPVESTYTAELADGNRVERTRPGR